MVESTPEDHSRAGATTHMLRELGIKRQRAGARGLGVWQGQKNDSGKPPSNPRGWPDRCMEADLEERPHRRIIINAEQDLWFSNNYVRTSKYTLLDFLPRFLMEEFHPRRKMANVYFLVLASLQTIREISNTFGVPTILIPLSFVVMVGAIFAIIEDVARHRADAKANASPTRVLDVNVKRSTAKFRGVAWSDVQVGDLLLVKNRENIPADLLIIATHEPNPKAKTGICYVETKSLDGETNLKIRQAIRPTMSRVASQREAAVLRGFVEMEHPNKLIDNFSGSIEVEGAGTGSDASREAIQTRNLLLRGCVLRNTRWVVGLVLNTGQDTKIIMSSLEPPHKSSRLEQRTNVEVWRIVQLLCFVCLLGAVGSLVWNVSVASDHDYLEWEFNGWWSYVKEAIIQFLYLFLLLGNFIPVSLYVSMTIVKSCQAFFMRQDLDMYHKDSDTPALVRTMALNEELGQVSHVFSDKTGTLTQNVMEFRKCCVGGVSYGRGVTDIGRAVAAEMGEEISKEDLDAEKVISERPAIPHVRFYDPRMGQDLEGAAGEEQRALLFDFFAALAVCHTVIPEKEAPKRSRRSRLRRPARQFTSDSEIDDGQLERSMRERSNQDGSGVCVDDEAEMAGEGREGEENWAEEDLEKRDGGQPPKLSASSPDDEALVLGARFFGMEFRDRLDNSACVRLSGPFVKGGRGRAGSPSTSAPLVDLEEGKAGEEPSYVDERYKVLRLLDFTSVRKRMSVIVRNPRGRVRILSKGADSVMIPRLASTTPAAAMERRERRDVPEGDSNEVAESQKRTMTVEHMERYAREGLRTLLVACGELDSDWFIDWDKKFEAASTDLVEVEKKKRGEENDIDALMDQVEVNLRLLGCTAIEDKLQEGVGHTVRALQNAGVKVWMLTGDKEETAVNIGVACQLLPPENAMERIIVNMDPQTGCRDVRELRDRLEGELRRFMDNKGTAMTSSKRRREGEGEASREIARPRALVIDGQALTLATQPLCRNILAELSMECAAVVGCRVSPDQKREVVALIRETQPESRTLAIGDGANDVAMIQGAHIGIGISGQEGMQAVNASDFAIAQFRFLGKLMLFHGRQNYRRMSKLVVYTFYKNVLMAAPMAWYVMVNGYSGQKFYTEGGIQMYNLLFTTLPVLFLGCFDRDVTLGDTERFPGLYVLGINDVFFNPKVFWSWMSQAIAEAALITFVPLFLLKGGPQDFGSSQSLFSFGGTTFTLVVLVANSKMLWLQYRWTWWAALLVIFSILAWFGVACAITALIDIDFDFFTIYFQLLSNPTFWAVVSLCVTVIAMRDLTWKFFHRWWQPKLHHIILEAETKGGDPVNLSLEECVAAAARGGGLSGVGARGARSRRRGSSSVTDLISAPENDGTAATDGPVPGSNSSNAYSRAVSFSAGGADGDDSGFDVTSPTPVGKRQQQQQQQRTPRSDSSERVLSTAGFAKTRRKRSSVVSPAFLTDVEFRDAGVGLELDVETMPPEPCPPLIGLSTPLPIARSSDIDEMSAPAHGGVVTRPEQPRPPMGGYTYSTDKPSASLESDMILNYVQFPLKKTVAFLEAPRPTLDRLVLRHRDSGILSNGQVLWKQKNSAGAVGPRPYLRETPASNPAGGNSWRAPSWLGGSGRSGDVENGASVRSRGGVSESDIKA